MFLVLIFVLLFILMAAEMIEVMAVGLMAFGCMIKLPMVIVHSIVNIFLYFSHIKDIKEQKFAAAVTGIVTFCLGIYSTTVFCAFWKVCEEIHGTNVDIGFDIAVLIAFFIAVPLYCVGEFFTLGPPIDLLNRARWDKGWDNGEYFSLKAGIVCVLLLVGFIWFCTAFAEIPERFREIISLKNILDPCLQDWKHLWKSITRICADFVS